MDLTFFYEQSRLLSTPQSTGCGACFCFDEHSCRFLLGFSSCGQLAGVWASNRDRRVWPQEPNSGPCEQICLHRHGGSEACCLSAGFGRSGCVESADQRYGRDPKRDYAYAHHALFKKLPVIGKGGGSAFTANPKRSLRSSPTSSLPDTRLKPPSSCPEKRGCLWFASLTEVSVWCTTVF